MKKHHTKFKGDIGLTKVIAELTELNFPISLPISKHQQYDIIVDFNGILKRAQVKYSSNGAIRGATSFVNSNGKSVYTKYNINDFDLYVLYIPELNKCLYIPNTNDFTSIYIRHEHPKTNNSRYYWWEDFLNPQLDKLPPKRKLSDFGVKPKVISRNKIFCKVQDKPTKDELIGLLKKLSYVQIGKIFGVSDNAVRKWAKKYDIIY